MQQILTCKARLTFICAKNHGTYIGSSLSFKQYPVHLSCSFYQPRQIRVVCSAFSVHAAKSLVRAFIASSQTTAKCLTLVWSSTPLCSLCLMQKLVQWPVTPTSSLDFPMFTSCLCSTSRSSTTFLCLFCSSDYRGVLVPNKIIHHSYSSYSQHQVTGPPSQWNNLNPSSLLTTTESSL